MAGLQSRDKGKRGERAFAEGTGGERIWWAQHDVLAYGRPWEVKSVAKGYSPSYQALEEFLEHEPEQQYLPIVAAKMDRRPWLVIQYLCCWQVEHGHREVCAHG